MKLHVCDLGPHDHAYIIPFSDLHVGDPAFNERKLQSYIAWVAERPNAFGVLNGDLGNVATRNSVSDIYDETMPPRDQRKKIVSLFTPIKHKLLAGTWGNHDRRIWKESGEDFVEVICEFLGVPYFREEAWLKVRVGEKPKNGKPVAYTVYMTHGGGGGRRPGGKVNRMEDLSHIGLADIYISGHTHFMTTFQDVYFVPDPYNDNVREMKRTFVSSGAYLDRGGYAKDFGFPPVKLGSPRIRLDGKVKDVHVSI